MAKTFTAPFAQTPKTASANLTTATTVDGATATALITAGTDGCIVTKITAMPKGTITATGLVLYISPSTGAKTAKDSIALAAYTYAATAKLPMVAFSSVSESTPIRLGAGEKLFVGTLVAAAAPGIDVSAEYTEF